MTIKEVSEKYHITQDTLRYYERVGMLPPVRRTPGGMRDYGEKDCSWVELAITMRNAGVSVETMSEYVRLTRAGDGTIPARLKLLRNQKAALVRQKEQMKRSMEQLDDQIRCYENVMERTAYDHTK